MIGQNSFSKKRKEISLNIFMINFFKCFLFFIFFNVSLLTVASRTEKTFSFTSVGSQECFAQIYNRKLKCKHSKPFNSTIYLRAVLCHCLSLTLHTLF